MLTDNSKYYHQMCSCLSPYHWHHQHAQDWIVSNKGDGNLYVHLTKETSFHLLYLEEKSVTSYEPERKKKKLKTLK